jgi:hypothetical protein
MHPRLDHLQPMLLPLDPLRMHLHHPDLLLRPLHSNLFLAR